jgi:IS30 family transposase
MPGSPLSLLEREEIGVALIKDQDVAWAVIGRRIGRHPTTISREVMGRGGRKRYRPAGRRQAGCQGALQASSAPTGRIHSLLRDRVTAELRLGRSPLAIWADFVADGIDDRVCVESIYAAVYAGVFDVKATECLRSHRPRRRRRQARNETTRPGLPNIAVRPASVGDRSELGHWEGDQIIGANNRSSMLWLTEQVTRYSIGITMPEGYSGDAMLAGLADWLDRIPVHLLRSITFDQGSEWAEWQQLVDTYGLDAWFCDPHSPWQRGQVENLNRQWRWCFPRGTELASIEPDCADHVASNINNQRRRSLSYKSPASLFAELTVQ